MPVLEKVEKESREPDPADLDLKTWYQTMGGGGSSDIKIVVSRIAPPTWKLPNGRIVHIGGKIPGAEYDEIIDETFLESTFGGGTFKLMISKRDDKGRMGFWKGKQVKIAGDPVINPDMLSKEAYNPLDTSEKAPLRLASEESPTATMHALDTMKEVMDDLRQDRGRGDGFDPQMMQMIMQPMRDQLVQMAAAQTELQRQLLEKDKQLLDLLHRKPETTVQDTLIGKMWDSESGRIEAIRTQHASELRQVQASFSERESQLHKQHERDLTNKEKDTERVIATMQAAHTSQVEGLKSTFTSQIKGLESMHALEVSMLKNRITDLDRELTKSEAKVAALDAVKQQSVLEKATELKQLKEALRDEKDDDDDDKAPTGLWGTLGKVAEGIIDNPEIIGQVLGARGGPPQAPPPPQEVPTRLVRTQNGQVMRVPMTSMPPPVVVQQAPGAAAPPPPTGAPAPAGLAGPAPEAVPLAPKAPPPRPPNPVELAAAVQFLESSCNSGQDPVVFAQSARSLVPADVLAYLEKVGVDQFLNSVPSLDQGSPLRTVQGRTFVRKVAKTLLTGSPE